MSTVSTPAAPAPIHNIPIFSGKDKPVEKEMAPAVLSKKIEAPAKNTSLASDPPTGGGGTRLGSSVSEDAPVSNPVSYSQNLTHSLASEPSVGNTGSLSTAVTSVPTTVAALPPALPSGDSAKTLSNSGAVIPRGVSNTAAVGLTSSPQSLASTNSVSSVPVQSVAANSTVTPMAVNVAPQTFQQEFKPTPLTVKSDPIVLAPQGTDSRPPLVAKVEPMKIAPQNTAPANNTVTTFSLQKDNNNPPLPVLPLVIPPKSDTSGNSNNNANTGNNGTTGNSGTTGSQSSGASGQANNGKGGASDGNAAGGGGGGGDAASANNAGTGEAQPVAVVAAATPVQAVGTVAPAVNLSDGDPTAQLKMKHVDGSFYTDENGRQRVRGPSYNIEGLLLNSEGSPFSSADFMVGRTVRITDSKLYYYTDATVKTGNTFSFSMSDESTDWLVFLLPSSMTASASSPPCPETTINCFPLSETEKWARLNYTKQEDIPNKLIYSVDTNPDFISNKPFMLLP